MNSPAKKNNINNQLIILNQITNNIIKFLSSLKSVHLLILLILIIVLVLFWSFIIRINLFLYQDIGSDTVASYYPVFYYISNAIKSWQLTPFSFSMGLGNDILSHGTFWLDPFILFLIIIPKSIFSYGFVYFYILKLLFAGLAFYYFLFVLGLKKRTCLIFALIYAFNGHIMLWGQHHFFATHVALLPLALIAYEKLHKENKGYFFSFIIALLSTNFYLFFQSSIFLFFYILFRNLLDKKCTKFSFLFIKLIYFLNYYILGLGLGALLSLPIIDYISNSSRINHDIMTQIVFLKDNFFKFNNLSYYTSSILRFFSNNLSGFGKYYFGFSNYYESPILFSGSILSTLFIIQGFFIKKNRRLNIILLIGLVLSLIAIFFPSISLIFNALQFPNYRWTYILIIIQLIIAAISFDYVWYKKCLSKKILLITSSLVILVILGTNILGFVNNQYNLKKFAFTLGLTMALSFIILIYFLVLNYNIKKNYNYLSFIILVLVFEIVFQNYPTVNLRGIVSNRIFKENYSFFNKYQDKLKNIPNDEKFYRAGNIFTADNHMIEQTWNFSLIYNFYDVKGYNSMEPAKNFNKSLNINATGDGRKFTLDALERPFLAKFLSVKYLLTDKLISNNHYTFFKKIDDENFIYENINSLPLGFVYYQQIKKDEFEKINISDKERILLKAAVMENEIKGIEQIKVDDVNLTTNINDQYELLTKLNENTFEINEFQENKIKGKIALKEKGLLFFSIPYLKNWNAYVDGKKAEIIKINYDFIGILLEEGEYEVVLKYQNESYKKGAIISFCALIILSTIVLIDVKKSKN